MFSSFRDTLQSDTDRELFDNLVREIWKSKTTKALCIAHVCSIITWRIFSAFFIWAPVLSVFSALCLCYFEGFVVGEVVESLGERIRSGGDFMLLGILWVAFGYVSFELSNAVRTVQLPIDKHAQLQFQKIKNIDEYISESRTQNTTSATSTELF